MTYIQAPDLESLTPPSLFLAGGITGCPPWQSAVAKTILARSPNLTVINPRREHWDMNASEDVAAAQIAWEYGYISRATAHLFWFAEETVQPIALFELGRVLGLDRPLFIGAHPNYSRRFDLIQQVKLARPEVDICSSYDGLLYLVGEWSLKFGAMMARRG